MRVLVVLTGAMQFDGITNSVLGYYSAMDRSSMQIDIVSSRYSVPEMRVQFEELGCRVLLLENRDKRPFHYFLQLTKLVREGKYEIIHAHGNSATLAIEMIASLIGGCKVRIVHSRNSSCEHRKIDRLLRPFMYAAYTDGLACGEKAGKWLFGNRPFIVMQNGKDIGRFLFNDEARKKTRAYLDADDNTILLGHVGLFHKQKNHDFLIDIFQEIVQNSDRYRLVLIGDGEEESVIRSKVRRLNLTDKVVFLGRQSNVEEWIQGIDIMVFPSWFEGMPNVVLEWQLAGLPALISDRITRECKITDLVEYLPLEAGAKQWAAKIMEIPVCERYGKQAEIKILFENAGFDIQKNACVLKNRYEQLINKKRGYRYEQSKS